MIYPQHEIQGTLSPKLMGILNVTPDSFFDGGFFKTIESAVTHAHQMVKDGADIIDIGGESTRPNAKHVSIAEECDRVIPVIERLKNEISIPISIDSRHGTVIKAALQAGVDIVNDVTALHDEQALAVVASYGVPVCLMHMKGTPQTMQVSPAYDDVVREVYCFLEESIERCEKAGILRENIWIDPGFGFGKNLAHNLTLLGKLPYFKTLACPILVGLSRKSMFGEILNVPAEQRLYGSLAGAALALMQGATIIRTHDVAATKDVLAVFKAVKPYLTGE